MEINIIGMGIGRELAPEGIRWGLTRSIFDTDLDVSIDVHKLNTKGFKNRLAECTKKKVVMYSVDKEDSPYSRAYPLKEIVKEFNTAFFSNSVCYAIALAVFKGADIINLYGINHFKNNKKEYQDEKPGVDYWIGIAKGRGVEININEPTEVGKTSSYKLYGYGISQEDVCGKFIKTM